MADFVPCVTKCNTCKVIFETTDDVKDHYRTDWHVMNSRRRGNQLPPITFDEFKKTQKKVKPDLPKAVPATRVASIPTSTIQNILKVNIVEPVSSSSTSSVPTESIPTESHDSEEESEKEKEFIELPVTPQTSLFDTKCFETTDECVAYMSEAYGFFIPDRDNLQDLDGLLQYLGEKVKRGGLCLFCQKQFGPGWSCMNHMIDKSHCKISYEEDDDFDELEDFYDFESTFEDIGSDEEDDEEEVEGVRRTLKISHIGELVLVDGRLAGHRDLRKYYKQYFAPVENRPSVLAVKRENLLKLGYEKLKTADGVMMNVSHMSDVQIMKLIEMQHKEEKKGRMMADRALRKVEFHTKRVQEYSSTVDKLRSSGNRNALIRDYHKRLM